MCDQIAGTSNPTQNCRWDQYSVKRRTIFSTSLENQRAVKILNLLYHKKFRQFIAGKYTLLHGKNSMRAT